MCKYRPKIDFQINEYLHELIEKRWNEDPNERPTFDEIFKRLSFLNEEEKNEYFLDDVDVDEFVSEVLFKTKSIDSIDFINILKNFSEIIFEIQYPSEIFINIYD